MRINFFGDFVCPDPENINIKEDLKQVLDEVDYNIINIEAPVKSNNSKQIHKSGPNIYQSQISLEWLVKNKFNCFALANNHMMDFGKESAEETIKILSSYNYCGCGSIKDCYKPTILVKDNIKIALFSTTHREFSCAEDYNQFGCAWMLSPRLLQEIEIIRGKVDFIFIYNHGGLEYCDLPLPQYRELYRFWIDRGIDAVIGSHPHVPQGWEKYNNKYILYSLGNFCFEKKGNKFPQRWNESICAQFNITKESLQLNIIPLVFETNIKTIGISHSKFLMEHLDNLNLILSNKDLYDEEIIKCLKSFIPVYKGMYSMSGYTVPRFNISFIKDILRNIIKKDSIDSVHHLNMYRCETHRWVMEHLLTNESM